MTAASKAYLSALTYLKQREHGCLELQEKLSKKGYAEAEIQQALEDLMAQGYQSDARFVESFIRLRKSQGYGPLRIRYDLMQKKISTEFLEEFLNEQDPEWQELAEKLRVKKFGEAQVKDFKEKSRQAKYLYSHGFVET